MDIRLTLYTGDYTSCTNERTAVDLVYGHTFCCFWERLSRKIDICNFELVGRKEISIVHVTYSFQLADLPKHITTVIVLRLTPDDMSWRSSWQGA